MQKDKVIALVGALCIAGGFGFGLEYFSEYFYNTNARKSTVSQDFRSSAQNVSSTQEKTTMYNRVLVAKENISVGDVLLSRNTEWIKWPIENVSREFIAKDENGRYLHPSLTFESIVGLVANSNIVKGVPISVKMFIKKNSFNNNTIRLRKGMRAMSAPVDKTSIKHNAFKPGDIVEVYLPNKTKKISNVRILAFDSRTEISKYEAELSDHHVKEHQNFPDTVTLELTEKQADIMIQNLKGGGRVYLVLMSEDDTDDSKIPFANNIYSENQTNNVFQNNKRINEIKQNMNNTNIPDNKNNKMEDESMVLVIKKDKAGFVKPHASNSKIGDEL